MIVGARSLYAFSREWPFLSLTAGWDARRGTPLLALLAQSAIALGLVALAAVEEGGVRMMVEFTAPVFWAFLVLVGLGFFVLRRRFPGAPRPFTVPGYPVLPLVFIATCAYLFYSSLVYARSQHAVQVSFYLMAVGLVAWAIARGAGADVNAPLRDGTTPLMILAGQARCSGATSRGARTRRRRTGPGAPPCTARRPRTSWTSWSAGAPTCTRATSTGARRCSRPAAAT